jgi:hypothetical protein
MLKTFCAGANLRALLQGKNCPDALRSAVPLLENKWVEERRMGTNADVNHLGDIETNKLDNGKKGLLLTGEYELAFEAGFKSLGQTFSSNPGEKSRSVNFHKRVMIGGRVFAVANQAGRDAEVFFQPLNSEQLVPGVITAIFSISHNNNEVFVLSILRRKPAPSGIANPFARYPDFGAQLWSVEHESSKVCIPTTQPVYHSQSRPWAQGVVVLKPIIPVSETISNLYLVLTDL